MTLYNFKTYSGDHYIMLSDVDDYTVEELFRKYMPEEYYCWQNINQPFSYISFSRSYIKDYKSSFYLIDYGYIDLSKMEKDKPYFSDFFNTLIKK